MSTQCVSKAFGHVDDWFCRATSQPEWNRRSFAGRLRVLWEAPTHVLELPISTEQRFYALADEWEHDTAHISSVTDMTNHPRYREIVSLGMKIVPVLLRDLQENQRYWFPALAAITGIRPFDPKDAGNGRRMTDAWVTWGKRKGLI